MIKENYFVIKIFIIGLLGVLSLLLSNFQYSIELPQEITSQFSSREIQLLLLVNPLIFLFIAVLIGSICFGKVGLKAPILSSKFNLQKLQPLIREFLKVGVISGIGVGVILLYRSFFGQQSSNFLEKKLCSLLD